MLSLIIPNFDLANHQSQVLLSNREGSILPRCLILGVRADFCTWSCIFFLLQVQRLFSQEVAARYIATADHILEGVHFLQPWRIAIVLESMGQMGNQEPA